MVIRIELRVFETDCFDLILKPIPCKKTAIFLWFLDKFRDLSMRNYMRIIMDDNEVSAIYHTSTVTSDLLDLQIYPPTPSTSYCAAFTYL